MPPQSSRRPDTSASPEALLRHILDEAVYLLSLKAIDSGEQLRSDETLSRAVVRSLEVIGEAASKVEPEFRSTYPEVPWVKMVAIRNRLIHGYMGIDYNTVLNVLRNEVPALRGQVEAILVRLGDASDA